MRNPFLIGQRLYLRPVELDDVDRLAGWLNDPAVRRFLHRNAPLNRVAEERFVRERLSGGDAGDDAVLVIALREDDRPIGTVGLHPDPETWRAAELGIAIGEAECWGRGFGPEAIRVLLDHAFGELGLNRVGLRVFASNERARAAYQKVGFVEEGVQRQGHFTGGRAVDVVWMAVLAQEWLD